MNEQAKATSDHLTSLLLIDDDEELCELMTEFFSNHEMKIETATNGQTGLLKALSGGHDLVLLDVMMPGLDGFDVLRHLRRQSQIPVIMLTAKTDEVDRIAGLNSGADDYLPKPFGPHELMARIRAVLRRSGRLSRSHAEAVVESAGIRVEPTCRKAFLNDHPIDLTTTEFDLLELLVRSSGRILSRNELSVALYQQPYSPLDRSLDVHVAHLRKKLGPTERIRTVRGTGYLFGPPSRSEGDQ